MTEVQRGKQRRHSFPKYFHGNDGNLKRINNELSVVSPGRLLVAQFEKDKQATSGGHRPCDLSACEEKLTAIIKQ